MSASARSLPRQDPDAATSWDASQWAQAVLQRVEQALQVWVPLNAPAGLGDVMRYGILDGGKRLRALLVHATAHAVDWQGPHLDSLSAQVQEASLRAACAVELIHAYSLVHDDMPCMDNDVMRRGKPTVHVQYGEARAMLAGDAMQALAFEVLTPSADECPSMPAVLQAELVRLLARAAGQAGMAGGQAIDLASVGQYIDEHTLRDMHRRKTGALLRASVMMGAAAAGVQADTPLCLRLQEYGQAVGLAFQIVDDVLDETQSSESLGKTAGKDAQAAKPTYVSLLGLERARDEAQHCLQQALQALQASGLGDDAVAPLKALALQIVHRDR